MDGSEGICCDEFIVMAVVCVCEPYFELDGLMAAYCIVPFRCTDGPALSAQF